MLADPAAVAELESARDAEPLCSVTSSPPGDGAGTGKISVASCWRKRPIGNPPPNTSVGGWTVAVMYGAPYPGELAVTTVDPLPVGWNSVDA